jgi:hypothetical protein
MMTNTQAWIGNSSYWDWLQANYAGQNLKARCGPIVREMVKEFPELKACPGHYICPVSGQHEHWWCETEDGEIVDPTYSQFVSQGFGEYEPWPEGEPIPIGKCFNCGGLVYTAEHGGVCSENCHIEYRAYLMEGVRR